MVNLHFLSLIEALQEINSIVLANVSHFDERLKENIYPFSI